MTEAVVFDSPLYEPVRPFTAPHDTVAAVVDEPHDSACLAGPYDYDSLTALAVAVVVTMAVTSVVQHCPYHVPPFLWFQLP